VGLYGRTLPGGNDYAAPLSISANAQGITAWNSVDVYSEKGAEPSVQTQSAALAWIGDGLSNTLLLVELANLPHFEPEHATPETAWGDGGAWAMLDRSYYAPSWGINRTNWSGAFSYHRGGINALVADGSVRWIAETTDEAVMAALFTRDGGEPIDWNKVR
jgi:hypothetical protein